MAHVLIAAAEKVAKDRYGTADIGIVGRVASRIALQQYPPIVEAMAWLCGLNTTPDLRSVLEKNTILRRSCDKLVPAIRGLVNVSLAQENPVSHVVLYSLQDILWEDTWKDSRVPGRYDWEAKIRLGEKLIEYASNGAMLERDLPTPDEVRQFIKPEYLEVVRIA